MLGEHSIMAEIAARGPVTCTIAVTDELEAYTGGVFNDTTGAMGLDHDIEVVGYGADETDGTPFWLIRNRRGVRPPPSLSRRIARRRDCPGRGGHPTTSPVRERPPPTLLP